MKLVPKLTLMFIFSTSAVLGVNGYLRVRREVGLFESDRVRDHQLMARVVAHAALASWNEDGAARAITMVDEIGVRTPKLRIRWHPIPAAAPTALDSRVARLVPGETLSIANDPTAAGHDRCIYATLATGQPPTGAIEICESLAAQDAYVRKTVVETVITTATLATVCALLSGILGLWLVGKPISALSAKARRIGAGDFSQPLRLPRKDELSSLAEDMNAMCEQLASAAARVEQETASRMAAVEQLRHADRLTTVGKLASGLAHELGTPLNVIEARADMIASGETTPEESADYARVIRDASERMTRLIRSLLDFARPRIAHAAPQRLFELAAKTVDMLQPLAARKRVTLTATDLAPGAGAVVDADQLLQVLTNLVVNAIQAMARPGTVALSVSKQRVLPPADHGGAEGEYLCVCVKDEGMGIRKEDFPHLFEPFFTTKDVGSGTGLGLAVAYGIVRDHHGWIDVQTELDKGSAFRVFLPTGVTA
ncbi:MAG: HAMP domain-containing sensor histidine kinase [Polyangiaceae bacterium]